MRALFLPLLILSSCTFPMGGGECLVTPPAASAFLAEVPEGLPADISAALSAGRVAEAAAASVATFDEKMVEIARDPDLSAEWAKVVTPGAGDTRATARAAHVASDLPVQANRLRAAKVSQSEVRAVLDAATRGRMSAADTAELLATAADAAEKSGAFDGFADFVTARIDEGARGDELARVVTGELEARGDKVGDKVQVCHKPDNPDKMKTLSIGAAALEKHLAHGDTEGPCDGEAAGDGTTNKQAGKGGGNADKAAKGGGKGGGKGAGKGEGKGGGKGTKAGGKGAKAGGE